MMREIRGRRGGALALSSASAAVVGIAMLMATAMPSNAATTPSDAVGAVAPAAGTAGCGKTPTMKNGTYTMQVNGKSRTYILKLPDNYDNNHAYRLIFGVHWLGGQATDVANGGGMIDPYYGLLKLANNSAIFVAPQGLSEAMGTGWANTGGQDVTFFDSMITTVEAALCVDTTQLFSLGFSYGGGMSYALACARPKIFRAVAIFDGGIISGCSGGNEPVAYLQSHGVNDTVLPISMARTMRDRFVKNNGCTTANPPEPKSGSGQHTSYAYTGCSAGHPVEWYAFDGGHTASPPDNGKTWLPQATWKFFAQFQSA